ncbi:hypothetical protein PUND_a3345 [Pseudoalteromonas undina]|uniref:ABC transporter ATP-binding protein n=1 Tax=Pseudoalteromonas issachenkonii TaxID=152297 RepID=A0ABM6N7J1_9GAMM|nr:hypothetical protein PSM_A3043 [Pseudoalteromonas sp. SM9913]ATC92117.1 hypothetical protein PISS_a3451 [Pseudoalteromonas issachenkonii]ATD04620.1 hypothetical protein PTET_a3435 [Pseudoalteromonas tetraodonis]KAF7767381.1 hypothetical protein PUND_a3345 [Pseudoalteromonas undina]
MFLYFDKSAINFTLNKVDKLFGGSIALLKANITIEVA